MTTVESVVLGFRGSGCHLGYVLTNRKRHGCTGGRLCAFCGFASGGVKIFDISLQVLHTRCANG